MENRSRRSPPPVMSILAARPRARPCRPEPARPGRGVPESVPPPRPTTTSASGCRRASPATPTRRSRSTGARRSSTPRRPRSASRPSRLLREMGRLDEATARRPGPRSPSTRTTPTRTWSSPSSSRSRPRARAAEDALRRAAARVRGGRAPPADRRPVAPEPGRHLRPARRSTAAAARAWEMYLALDPGNFEAHVQRGTHLLLAGESEKAAAALKTALELQPDSARAYQILGDIYARRRAGRPGGPALPQGARDRARATCACASPSARCSSRRSGPQEALAEADAVLKADARQPLRPRPQGPLPARPAPLRRGRRRGRRARRPADPNDLKAAYLKVTIAESRRDFARRRGSPRGDPRPAARRRRGGRRATSACSSSTSASPTSSSSATPTRRRPSPARSPRATRPTPTSSASTPRRSTSRSRRTRRSPRCATARERFPDDVDLTGLEATLLREKGDTAGATAIVEAMRTRAPDDPKVLARVADFYRRARKLPRGREGAAPGARRPTRRTSACSSSSARCSSGRSGTTTPRPSSARRSPSSPTRPPCSTTSAT